MKKMIKTFIIEVHGYNNNDIETGLEEATNRMYDSEYKNGIYAEADKLDDNKIRGFKYEIIDDATDLIDFVDLELDQ